MKMEKNPVVKLYFITYPSLLEYHSLQVDDGRLFLFSRRTLDLRASDDHCLKRRLYPVSLTRFLPRVGLFSIDPILK